MHESDELWLVIPTANRFEYLPELFEDSKIPPNRRILIRTAPGPEIRDCTNIYETQVFNIHHWWNLGINYAKLHGGRYVAVLNDDVKIKPGVLQELLSVMKFEKTALALPVKKGDAAWGHCWIIDSHSPLKPDERFIWWCGDRDLEIQARRNEGISYKPLFTLNIHANELTVANPNLEDITLRDIKSFYRKYPFKSAMAYPNRLLTRLKNRFILK